MPNQSNKRSHSRTYRPSHIDSEDEVSSWDSRSVSSSHSTSSSSSSSDDALISKLPTLPDLRFEQSYLATIRGFLHEEQTSSSTPHDQAEKQRSTDDSEEDHHHKVELTHDKVEGDHELWLGNLRVEWFPILYVTVRDQLLSPLVQGAVWGLGGLLLTQFRQYLSATKASRSAKGGAGRGTPSILRSLGLGKR